MPLYNSSTALESAIQFDRGDALVTRIADRGRARHAKENQFQAYDHFLSFYWEHRTAAAYYGTTYLYIVGEGLVPWDVTGSFGTLGGVTPVRFSARIAPQLVGIGLLEALPEATILAMEDPNDSNGNGISGRANRIADPVTGQTRLGRFGWKAGTTSVKHQIASAFNIDMGVMTSGMPNPDCGSNQNDCGSSGAELADEHVNNLAKGWHRKMRFTHFPVRKNRTC